MNKPIKKYFTALDIGTSKICAIIAEQTENNKLKIIGFSETDSEGMAGWTFQTGVIVMIAVIALLAIGGVGVFVSLRGAEFSDD